MSKDLSAQLIGVGIFAPKQSPRTPKVRNTKTAGITLNQSSSFSKVVEQKSNRPPIITAQSNRASIQSRLSPRNLSFGTVSCATDLYSHRQSTGVFRKTTVDYLMMHQTSKPEPLATCKAQIPSLQFMKTFEECKELSNLQDLRRHNLSVIFT